MAAESQAQTMEILSGPECYTGEHFFTFIVGNFPAPVEKAALSRLFVDIYIPYDNLQFVRQDSKYIAECTARIQITNHDGKVVGRKNWLEKRITHQFSETNSRDLVLSISGFLDVPPGDYVLHIEVMDHDTKKPFREEAPVLMKDFSGQQGAVSSIILLQGVPPAPFWENMKESLVCDTVDSEKAARLVAVCFSAGIPDSVLAAYNIRNQGGGLVTRLPAATVSPPGSPVARMAAGLPISDLPAGRYTISLERGKFSVGTSITIQSGMFTNLALAIEQLIYVASGEELDKMRLAEGNRKQELFDEFWKSKSIRNENGTNIAQNEYYGRVAYANRHFRETREGWRTDRGMIYIKFGPPDDIDSHPFDINSRGYEIWYYYNFGKTFYFCDLRGTGEYLLMRR